MKGQVCQVEYALTAILSNPARHPHHLKNFRHLDPGDRKILWDLVVRHWVLQASHPFGSYVNWVDVVDYYVCRSGAREV